MKILKSTFFRPKKCQYGNFELTANKGWEILQTFIDSESGLLVVSTIKSKEDHLKSGAESGVKQYLINLQSLQILSWDDHKEHFDYGLKESYSSDGKLRLISQRIHDIEKNNDFFIEKLYDAKMGTLISSGESLAFSESMRVNLLGRHDASLKLKQESESKESARLTLAELETQQRLALKQNLEIISFFDEFYSYNLVYEGDQFIMRKYRLDIDDSGHKDTVETYFFSSLDEFWEDLIRDSGWYIALRIDPQNSLQPYLLSKKIIETFNAIRKSTDLSYGRHEKIYNWEKVFMHADLKRGEIKQFCSNCAKEVKYNPRYPKYICRDCSSMDIFNKEGELLEFYNTDLSGGLKIIYKNSSGNILREDDSKAECFCLIDGKEFVAQEARFGGIVIQKRR